MSRVLSLIVVGVANHGSQLWQRPTMPELRTCKTYFKCFLSCTNMDGQYEIKCFTSGRRLLERGMHTRRWLQRPLLLASHQRARLQRVCIHERRGRQQRAFVLFSFTDEYRSVIRRHDGRMRCFRRVNEPHHRQCVHETSIEATNK